MIIKGSLCLLPLLLVALFTSISNAAWQGPVEIVQGSWGEEPGKFGLISGDTRDDFPTDLCVSSDGLIAIADNPNARVQVFKQDGSLISAFGAKMIADDRWKLGWPLVLGCFSNGIYTEFDKYKQIYAFDGTLKNSWDILLGGLGAVLFDDSFVTVIPAKNLYYRYSLTGQLLKTYTSRPLEIGISTSKSNKSGGYLYIVKFTDQIYSFVIPWMSLNSYKRDLAGNLVVSAQTNTKDTVYKISPCGRIQGQIQIPENRGHLKEMLGQEPIGELEVEYGQPAIAPNGDVYTWKRTPDKYSILKWTWVDDPNMPTGPEPPTNLSLTPSINGLYLTWKASPNDPGCVTKYEIARSTTSGGSFSTIDTVEKGVLKDNDTTASAGTTYYYKIRAVAGTEYSPYTKEVGGKR